jgi:hypothetical protein
MGRSCDHAYERSQLRLGKRDEDNDDLEQRQVRNEKRGDGKRREEKRRDNTRESGTRRDERKRKR